MSNPKRKFLIHGPHPYDDDEGISLPIPYDAILYADETSQVMQPVMNLQFWVHPDATLLEALKWRLSHLEKGRYPASLIMIADVKANKETIIFGKYTGYMGGDMDSMEVLNMKMSDLFPTDGSMRWSEKCFCYK